MSVYKIELNNSYANQEFDLIVPNFETDIHVLLQTNDNNSLFMSIFVNNEQLGNPFMCFPNQKIIPFPYIEELLGGNFLFETVSDEYPSFENFGDSCNLYFITLDELNEDEE